MGELPYDIDPFDEHDERFQTLEERLRRLRWPAPPPGLRERTLEECRRQLAERFGPASGSGHGHAGDDAQAPDRLRRRH